MDFSQKNLLSVALRDQVDIYKSDLLDASATKAEELHYLSHKVKGSIQNVQFCPYEDVLGIAHMNGISSVLVPGCGEPNFDALEANPYQSKNQRKQWEVKALMEKVGESDISGTLRYISSFSKLKSKIQPELISLDPLKLRQIDKKTLEEKMIERNKLLVRFSLFFFRPRTDNHTNEYDHD